MPVNIRHRVGRLGPVQKVLLGSGTLAMAALLSTGVAAAATSPAHPAPSAVSHTLPTRADTDNVQSGDQTGPDTTVADVATAGDKADSTTAPDTDTIQSGDQTSPDTTVADVATAGDKADSTTAPDTDTIQSGSQTSPDTEVSGR